MASSPVARAKDSAVHSNKKHSVPHAFTTRTHSIDRDTCTTSLAQFPVQELITLQRPCDFVANGRCERGDLSIRHDRDALV